jgi:hypothetical protein
MGTATDSVGSRAGRRNDRRCAEADAYSRSSAANFGPARGELDDMGTDATAKTRWTVLLHTQAYRGAGLGSMLRAQVTSSDSPRSNGLRRTVPRAGRLAAHRALRPPPERAVRTSRSAARHEMLNTPASLRLART